MSARVFVDTNILVYAHDLDAGEKHERAKQRVTELWRSATSPTVSVQVLQELFVNLQRKGVPRDAARELVEDYLQWRVVENTGDLLLEGIAAMDRWSLTFWDALIVAAARKAGAKELWSEDLNVGQDYGGVKVVNPLV
jgi:predicted nucleic acid-binding protein